MHPSMLKLKVLCESWGGRLNYVSHLDYDLVKEQDGYFEAPFTGAQLGILWATKAIYYSDFTDAHPYEIIHEMGHVFACAVPPYKSNEYDFLGWEYALCRHVGYSPKAWVIGNRDYGVNDGSEMGGLTPPQVRALLNERMAFARAIGLLQGYKPVAIR
jgi:hypothetical protein